MVTVVGSIPTTPIMNIKKLNIIDKTDSYYQSKNDVFLIGCAQILDGLVGIISLGRYNGGYSANVIQYVVLKNIRRRKLARE